MMSVILHDRLCCTSSYLWHRLQPIGIVVVLVIQAIFLQPLSSMADEPAAIHEVQKKDESEEKSATTDATEKAKIHSTMTKNNTDSFFSSFGESDDIALPHLENSSSIPSMETLFIKTVLLLVFITATCISGVWLLKKFQWGSNKISSFQKQAITVLEKKYLSSKCTVWYIEINGNDHIVVEGQNGVAISQIMPRCASSVPSYKEDVNVPFGINSSVNGDGYTA